MKDRSVRVLLFVLGLIVASVIAAAMPAGASQTDPDAALLRSAAQEFAAMIQPYTVTLQDDTTFFHWTFKISQPEELQNYIQIVSSNYGKPSPTDDWEGPGLYLAQDPTSSIAYGNHLVILKIRKGSQLFYINAKGALPFSFDKSSKVREWLTKKAAAVGTVPKFDSPMTPHWLSDTPGGGDLVRAAGIVGYLYQWNLSHAPSDCAQGTSEALDLIDSSVVVDSKITTADFLFNTPKSQMISQHVSQDLINVHILSFDMDDETGNGDWKSVLSSQELSDYTAWKHAHLFYCQKPYLSTLFPETVQR